MTSSAGTATRAIRVLRLRVPVLLAGILITAARDLVVATARTTWHHRAWLSLAGAYFALAVWLVMHSDLIVLDSLARTAHAYFVWHNGPPKLAGLGFVWPPITTLTLLPFTLPRGFGATALAAPIVSSLAMAGTVVLVARELQRLGLPRGYRYAAVALLAVHPMIVFYGANGMSEAWGVLFPTLALIGAIRWYEQRSMTALGVASFASAGALLSRYELGVVAVILLVGIVGVIAIGERENEKARAVALFFALPPAYGLGVWMFFNWTVQGSPIWFLTNGGQLATVAGTASTVGTGSSVGNAARLSGIVDVLWAHAMFAPGLLIAVIGLVIYGVICRKRRFALVLAALVASSLLTNVLLIGVTGSDWLSSIRFNMRDIPLVAVAAGWLIAEQVRAGRPQLARVLLISWVALAAVALPLTVHAMQSSRLLFDERIFLAAITSGDSQTGNVFGDRYVGCDGARDMGQWITANISGRDSVLADNSTSYAVLMFSHHPELFLDRVDKGDAYFLDQVAQPSRKVQYLLTSDGSWCSGVSGDLVQRRIDGLREARLSTHLAHSSRGFSLYRVGSSRQALP